MKKSMNQNRKKSSQSVSPVSRSVTLVDPPPFQEFFASFAEKPRQPDEFTVAEFQAATGMREAKARKELVNRAESGQLLKRNYILDGCRVVLYRLNK
jgi:hypothetical protein